MGIIARIANAARAAVRAFDMAGGSGRWPRDAMIYAAPRQELAARRVIATRASYLADNSAHGRSAVDCWCDSLVGDGPSARSAHPDDATRQELEAAWGRFYSDPDIEGAGADLCEFLCRVVRTVVIDGEAFVRLITMPDGSLRLALLSTEQVDATVNRELPNGARIIAGIEIDAAGRRVAYWIRPQADDVWLSLANPAVRVDAADILHVLDPRHAGAIRGMSWLSAIGTKLVELDRLEDSLLARMRTAALFCGFLVDPENQSGLAEGTLDPQQLSLEPGALRLLPPSASVSFPNMPGTEGAPELLRHQLRAIAAGCGIPYELLASDLSTVNYSSAKLSLESFRRRCKSLQGRMLVSRLLAPIWRRMVALEIVSGRLRAPGFVRNPDDYYGVSFLWPQWASLDPLKDAEANQIALANQIKSREQIIAEGGRDIADVDREISADPVPPPAIRPIAAKVP